MIKWLVALFLALVSKEVNGQLLIRSGTSLYSGSASYSYEKVKGVEDYSRIFTDLTASFTRMKSNQTGFGFAVTAAYENLEGKEFSGETLYLLAGPTLRYYLTQLAYFSTAIEAGISQNTVDKMTHPVNTERFPVYFDFGFGYSWPINKTVVLEPQLQAYFLADEGFADRSGIQLILGFTIVN
ncbi:MAG: hypothetical protein HUU10_15000 [Bacteroidetes bacterium]|nr:hypothetical protein [Bacteroidota bacterium]